MDQDQKNLLGRLLVASLDKAITEEEFRTIDHLLGTDPEAVEFYIHFMKIYTRFSKPGRLFAENQIRHEADLEFNAELWEGLAQSEKNAPAIPAAVQAETDLVIRKIERPRIVRQFNRTSVLSILVSTAAILFLILFARISPVQTGVDVAILSDSLNARWADINMPMMNGVRLSTSYTPYQLLEGAAEILFDNNARLVIESPAEFELVARDEIRLTHGRLYATIGREAVGFTVNTENAKIIDLGTEFAVHAGLDGQTELHVIKGETSLIAGEKDRQCVPVHAGSARQVSGRQGRIAEIACRNDIFIRHIDSEKHVAWRGQSLDLAHLIAGGSGLGGETYFVRINPLTGAVSTDPHLGGPDGSIADVGFRPVAGLGVIDGIAVPSGETVIDSQGHTFEFVTTTGNSSRDILAVNNGQAITENGYAPPVFGGRLYGGPETPVVMLHSNIVLTVDLQKVQGAVGENAIQLFRAQGGLPENVIGKEEKARVDVFVFVDGQVRWQRKDVTAEEGLLEIAVPISEEDRFLTFAVTEGDEDPAAWYVPWSNDFFYLAEAEFAF